ncbi:hypothetical protein TA3x_000144 [Tundrisphaera sp. TA3]|uniref:hypothetical protein n=1 Tax=Tundrisphaera sp. TA3 TaxID=3435775 RepID=UPI003EB6E234
MRQNRSVRLPDAMACLVALAGMAVAAADARGQAPAPTPGLRAGAATANITPPLGEPIVGNFATPPATHVHDELHARCLVLDDGATRLAFVVCDSVGVGREVFDEARKLAAPASGLPEGNILAAATHTHSATSGRSKNMLKPDPLGEYPRFLARRIADVIRVAVNNLEPARIGWGAVDVPGPVVNRRWHLKPGREIRNPFGGIDKVLTNPGRLNPFLLEPAGPTDPQVSFVSVQSRQGKPIALLANYSLHYVGGVPNGHISADYFAVFGKKIGELLGARDQDPPFVGIMSNGTSGDANNINPREAAKASPPYRQMAEVADEVAKAIAEAHRRVEFRDAVPLAAAHRELALATRKPTPEQLDYARKILAKPVDAPKYHPLERVYAERAIAQHESPDEISVMLQAFRIGDLGIAAIPFEVFAETGLEIKRDSPFRPTFTMELANGTYAYLPTPRHHALGGYETWLGTSKVEVDAAPKIVAALMDLFRQLRSETPSPAKP